MNDDDRTVQQTYSSSEHLSNVFLVNVNINLRLNQIFHTKPSVLRRYSTGKQKTPKLNW